MKLIINIPCYNEEKTLPLVLQELPKKIPGISTIEVQIVDDGSTDDTVRVAQEFGVDRIVKHKHNLGLGMTFKHGVEAALEAGCDVFVNTDGDNQYPSRHIKDIVKPIVNHEADVVVGNREPWKVKHFSWFKRLMQWVGNGIAREIVGGNVPDTVSGFRAYSRDTLLRLNSTARFSYVLDTIVQASRKGLKIVSVPISTNAPTRKSRLFKNIFQHMYKSASNIARCYVIYEPFKTFLILSLFFLIPALALSTRFALFYFAGNGSGHIQSLIAAAILFMLWGIMFALAVLAELLAMNRKVSEEELYLQRKQFYEK